MAVTVSEIAKVPGRPLAQWVEWRARRIADPVERLSYLRDSSAFWGKGPVRSALTGSGLHRAAMVLAAMLLPVPMVTDGAATLKRAQPGAAPVPEKVWLGENKPDYELYSNGLRIEKRFTARAEGAQQFQRWRVADNRREERAAPFGIVFHTTESDAIQFDESNKGWLNRAAEGTLGYVRAQRAYHFVIDRFGRVFRTVPEDEPANHAGNSAWANDGHYFVNMNHSFLGVSFDGQTRGPDGKASMTEAQIVSAGLLTDLLRSKYQIPAANCVTHAQVSVSSVTMGVGYHTDLASGFPYQRLRLPVNYLIPLPSITVFGFKFDEHYANLSTDELQDAISAAETILRQEASRRGLSTTAYRRQLAQRYRSVDDPHKRPNFVDATQTGEIRELRTDNP